MEIKDRKGKNIITISLNKALGWVVAAVIGTGVATAFGTVSLYRTLPFRVQAAEDKLTKLDDVPTKIEVIKNDIQTIKEDVKDIKNALSDWQIIR